MPATIDLVRDVLDSAVFDRNGREMGRVDALVLDLEPGRPPRVCALEIGPTVLAGRVHPALETIAAAIEAALGVGDRRPTRLEVTRIASLTTRVHLDVTAGETGAHNIELALRRVMRGRWK